MTRHGDVVCVECGEVILEIIPDDHVERCKDQYFNQSKPYKYSRGTHFRKTVERITGHTVLKPELLKTCAEVLKGYPLNHKCVYQVLKDSKLPYQNTSSIRRYLKQDVPTLNSAELFKLNQFFDYFCTEYEISKDDKKKNLPSIEFLLQIFCEMIERHDIVDIIAKKFASPQKEFEISKVVYSIMDNFPTNEFG